MESGKANEGSVVNKRSAAEQPAREPLSSWTGNNPIQFEPIRCCQRIEPDKSFGMRLLYVYIMSSSSRTLYVGVTTNLKRRVLQHRTGKSEFTRRYRICRLVYVERVGPKVVAYAREKQIKRLDR